MFTLKAPKWCGRVEYLEGRVAIERDGESGAGEPTYLVYLDGVPVGHIEKSTRTWERKSKGRMYVNARGRTPCWRIVPALGERSSRLTYDTRALAAFELALDHDGAMP